MKRTHSNNKQNLMELLESYGVGWSKKSLQEIYNVLGDGICEEAVAEAFRTFGDSKNTTNIISFLLDYNDSVDPPPKKSAPPAMTTRSGPSHGPHSSASPTGFPNMKRTPLDTPFNAALRRWPEDTRITLRVISPKVLELNGGLILNKHNPERGIEPVLNDFITLMRWPADVLDEMHKKYSSLSKLEIFDRLRALDEVSLDALEADLIEKSHVPEYECCICMDEYKITDMYTIGCPEMHKICFDCFGEAIKHAVTQGDVVKCPYLGCNYVLSQVEIEGFGDNEGGYVSKEIISRYCEQNLGRTLKSISGAIGCPTPGCANYVIVAKEDLSKKICCNCDGCGNSFCSHCRKIYHYHCECNEIPFYTERWIEWCTKRRNVYTEDKKKAMELYQHNKELVENFNNLKSDEEYKEQHGRLCPRCGRIIVKVDGCDSMVCGRNYHGGDVQDGCGANFNWSTARPYRSDIHSKKRVEPMPIPELAKEVVHEGVACNRCGDEIKGLRFTCIHCPCYDLCEKCEMEGTLEHPKDHIWRIISNPFEYN